SCSSARGARTGGAPVPRALTPCAPASGHAARHGLLKQHPLIFLEKCRLIGGEAPDTGAGSRSACGSRAPAPLAARGREHGTSSVPGTGARGERAVVTAAGRGPHGSRQRL